jgi:hypothetical protein
MLYTELHGFGVAAPARPATRETEALQAMNEIDAWDAPAYTAARAVLEPRYPAVSRFLFDNLEASVGAGAVAGVERFLDRVALLRDGKGDGASADDARAGAALLATRKILDADREARLRALVQVARLGARQEEVTPVAEVDPGRPKVAQAFIDWLNEWREVARVAVARRDYKISLGLAQRRRSADDGDEAEPPEAATDAAVAARPSA